jgi:glutathione peroxidase
MLYEMQAQTITGEPFDFSTLRGQPVLMVNTASACGFTSQFAGLEELWQTYRPAGLIIMGFPSNEFGHQDPGSNIEIATFCQNNYGVSFPMMAKVNVNGEQAHPLWKWLKAQKTGILGSEAIKWNFTKFLIDRSGQVVQRFGSTTLPAQLEADVKKVLFQFSLETQIK